MNFALNSLARMTMERSSAPAVFRLACSLTGFTPAPSRTPGVPFQEAFRRRSIRFRPGPRWAPRRPSINGKLLAGERDGGNADGLQPKSGLGTSTTSRMYRWGYPIAVPAKPLAPDCPCFREPSKMRAMRGTRPESPEAAAAPTADSMSVARPESPGVGSKNRQSF